MKIIIYYKSRLEGDDVVQNLTFDNIDDYAETDRYLTLYKGKKEEVTFPYNNILYYRMIKND